MCSVWARVWESEKDVLHSNASSSLSTSSRSDIYIEGTQEKRHGTHGKRSALQRKPQGKATKKM